MLNRIIKFSLNNKLLVMLAVLLVVIGGTYSARNIEVDVFPDLTMPTVVVLTDASNMAPEAFFFVTGFLFRLGRVRLGHGYISRTSGDKREDESAFGAVARWNSAYARSPVECDG